jgi:hypothetical protein
MNIVKKGGKSSTTGLPKINKNKYLRGGIHGG